MGCLPSEKHIQFLIFLRDKGLNLKELIVSTLTPQVC